MSGGCDVLVLHARLLEPEPFRAALREGLTPGRAFKHAHPDGDYLAALGRTAEGGLLDDEAGSALADAALQVGEPAGSLDLEGDEAWARRFVSIAGAALDDVELASRLLRGGWLGRTTRAVLGALPLRVVRQQVTAQTLARARAQVEVGWDSELINLLESGALRAERQPEHHLLVIGADLKKSVEAVPLSAEQPTRGFDLATVLRAARQAGAHDVFLSAGGEATVHDAQGARVLGVGPSAERLEAVAAQVGVEPFGVVAVSVEGVGRVRVSRSPAGLNLRLLGEQPFLARGLEPLLDDPSGLVVLGGPAASGRSTALSALLQGHTARGRVIASLEEPVSFPLTAFQWSDDANAFLRAVRTSPAQVIGVDLVDDARGVELALTLAREGRHVLVTLRGVSLAGVVHRLAVLDASAHRRRLSEHLAAVVLLAREQAEVLWPSEGLRRHLRANEAMPPPVLLEPAP
jgi:hypothetical protein